MVQLVFRLIVLDFNRNLNQIWFGFCLVGVAQNHVANHYLYAFLYHNYLFGIARIHLTRNKATNLGLQAVQLYHLFKKKLQNVFIKLLVALREILFTHAEILFTGVALLAI